MSDLQLNNISKRNNHLKTCVGVILVLFVFSVACAFGAEVLLVVGKKNLAAGKKELRAGDLAIKNHLVNRGLEVVVKEDEIVESKDASDKDLVILSESARSTKVGTKFRDVSVPVICSEPWLFSHLGMTGHKKKVDYGRKSHQRSILIINAHHPLCATCSKEVRVCSKSFFMGWGVPGENAIAVAGLAREPHKCTIFAYDAGVEMPGLVAPAKRVGLFLFRNTANAFTPEGWSLFDAAVDWSTADTETVLK